MDKLLIRKFVYYAAPMLHIACVAVPEPETLTVWRHGPAYSSVLPPLSCSTSSIDELVWHVTEQLHLTKREIGLLRSYLTLMRPGDSAYLITNILWPADSSGVPASPGDDRTRN